MSSVYWLPQPAYKDQAVHPFVPVNQPLVCLLDPQVPGERRHTARIDLWTGKQWMHKGEGYGRYHSVYPIPRQDYDCWNTGIPSFPGNYLVLVDLTRTASGTAWRVEPGYYAAKLEESARGPEWRIVRRSLKQMEPSKHQWIYEWIEVSYRSVLAWTDLPQIARPDQ